MSRIVCFGEIMLRLSPPGFQRLFQSPTLRASFGGGEANVAVSLAHFGLHSQYVTRLPLNPIGDAALRALRSEGVDVTHVARGGERLGIYFAETGASQRPSTVLYDRAHSSITEVRPGTFDWRHIVAGATWFHVTGITPALGPSVAECTREAIEAARAAGVRVSIDLNYRKKLWSETQARDVMRPLVALADVVIANEEDIQSSLGLEVSGTDVTAGSVDANAYRSVAEQVAHDFEVAFVAITLRASYSASRNGWSAVLYDAATSAFHQSPRYDVTLIDRIGGGDSFAAGLLWAMVKGRSPEAALRFAVAASALKQTIPGDFNRVSVAEVTGLADGDASGRVQR